MVTINQLDKDRRTQVVKCLCEGMSIRATVRVTGVAKNTVVKLLCEMGDVCADLHHHAVRGLHVRRLQCDEIWSLIGAKAKNVSSEQKAEGWGDVWTWVGFDADTKLCVSYLVGGRDTGWATDFMQDCAARIVSKPQITIDAHKPYLKAVEAAFGGDADFATLHKIYGAPDESEKRYCPAKCIGCDMKTISGVPVPRHVSTSHVVRHNLTVRMQMRRFT